METFIPLLVLLLLVAAILREDSVLVVFYLLGGVYLAGLWWSRNAFKHLEFRRVMLPRAFFDQKVTVKIEIHNRGWLPVVWIKIHESLPVELITPNFVQGVVTIGPRGKTVMEYELRGRKRGYYKIGPLFLDSGDLLGMARESRSMAMEDRMVVYPRIVPLSRMGVPSNSPFGTIHEPRPIFEDPTRVRGKRDYVAGDSLRRVDWKASAATGRLQVKNYEPSIAVETCIALDLDPQDYDPKQYVNSIELAIVAAASLANWVAQKKQAVGLVTNGLDPIAEECCSPKPLPPRSGSGALMQILEVLARIQGGDTFPLSELLRRASAGLSWGTTLLLVTSRFDEPLLEELFQAQRRGLNVMVVSVRPTVAQEALHRRAERFGIPVCGLDSESDLEVWGAPG